MPAASNRANLPATSDHLAPKPKPYTFKVGAKTYKIPTATEANDSMDGADFFDVMASGDPAAQMGYSFRAFAKVASPEALAAFKTLKPTKQAEVIHAWGEYGDGDGASLGESSGSSS